MIKKRIGAPPTISVEGNGIVLLCFGPVIVTERPLAEVLREMGQEQRPESGTAGLEGEDVGGEAHVMHPPHSGG